jgi:hypothetical protein
MKKRWTEWILLKGKHPSAGICSSRLISLLSWHFPSNMHITNCTVFLVFGILINITTTSGQNPGSSPCNSEQCCYDWPTCLVTGCEQAVEQSNVTMITCSLENCVACFLLRALTNQVFRIMRIIYCICVSDWLDHAAGGLMARLWVLQCEYI